MRTDPTETGGLFVGRRPGTAPTRFRALPQAGSTLRRQLDARLAELLLASMALLSLLCWGPIPALCLWIGSQVDYQSGSVSFGIFVAFAAQIAALFGTLGVLNRIDRAWILVRRAAGRDQRRGVLGRVFAAAAVLCTSAFAVWFVFIHGPGSNVPGNKPFSP